MDHSSQIMIFLLSITWLIVGHLSAILLFGLVDIFSRINLGSFAKVATIGTVCGFITLIALFFVMLAMVLLHLNSLTKDKDVSHKLIQTRSTKRK